jgi:hypothetical protein
MRPSRRLTKMEAQREFLKLLAGMIRDFPAHAEDPRITGPRTLTLASGRACPAPIQCCT